MKLALICTEKLPSPAIRGGAIQTMIDGVANYLRTNHDLTVFSVTDPELPEEEIREDIHYIRVPANHYVTEICEKLKESHYDLIHVFNRPVNIPEYWRATPNSRFILGLHNEMMHESKITTALGRQVIDIVSGITTVSDYIKNTVVRRFPKAEEKIHVVYSGVNLEEYPPVWSTNGQQIRAAARRQYDLENRKVILFAGRLSKNKGPHVLINAMRGILNKHPDAMLVIAGGKWFSDNRMNSYIRSLYRLSWPLRSHIKFTKFVPIDKMPELFLAADLFVCSSQWEEPLARVHYEAMAAGLPVITTNRGGNSEVLLHKFNGWLINQYQSPKAFAKAIDFLLSNPEFADWIARNGREYIEQDFQFSHTAERLEEVYQSTVASDLNSQEEAVGRFS
ncbi:MAG TPA: glycosyltransferase family 4 protein [Bacillales bacterium]